MNIVPGVLSLICGLLGLGILGSMLWTIRSAYDQMTANGTTEIVMVTGYLPTAIPLMLLGLIFGLFRLKRKHRIGRALSLIGILTSIASLLVLVITFLL